MFSYKTIVKYLKTNLLQPTPLANSKIDEEHLESIATIATMGIQVKIPEPGVVIIRQKEIVNSKIYCNKVLRKMGRALFATPLFYPVVYSIDLNSITTEWILDQMRTYRINAKDLQRQLGFKKEVVSEIIKAKRKLQPAEKSCLFYYFLALEAGKDEAVDEYSQI